MTRNELEKTPTGELILYRRRGVRGYCFGWLRGVEDGVATVQGLEDGIFSEAAQSRVVRTIDALAKAKLLTKHGRRWQLTPAGIAELKRIVTVPTAVQTGPISRLKKESESAVQNLRYKTVQNQRNRCGATVPRGTAIRYKALRAVGRLRPARLCTVPSLSLYTVQRYKTPKHGLSTDAPVSV